MRKILRSKWIKIPFYFFLVGFALIGFFLTVSYAAIMLRLTDEGGSVDANNRYFSGINRQYNQSFKEDVSKVTFRHHDALHRILILNKYYPKNAEYILAAYKKSNDDREILRMLDAVDLELKKDKRYMADLKRFRQNRRNFKRQYTHKSAYEWMNIAEWSVFKEAVVKDKALIDSVAAVTGVEGRLIVSCLVGEQIRLFNSNREAYKQWIGPLKILSVESQFSFGVTGIKEHTAKDIEQYLKDSKSTYYLGKKYEHLLDFSSGDPASERISRLTSFRNHFYSYMYAALFLKQVKVQWERAGFPIENRPEILATLFNVGYIQSVPKRNPRVGGSTIRIKDKPYTFGAIAYQFYYSGELLDIFPFEKKKFDWNEIN